MDQWIKRFDKHLAVERNVSPHTRSAYRRDLEAFALFLRETLGWEGAEEAVAARVDVIALRRYLALLHKSHKRSSIGR